MKQLIFRTILAATACCLTLATSATRLVHVYTFDSNLDDFVSATSLQSLGGTLTESAFEFTAGDGLELTSSAFSTVSYSVEMQFRIDEFQGTFTRLIDTNNAQSDNGLYLQGNVVRYYPSLAFGSTEISAGESVHLVMTRSADGFTRVYINGQFQLETQREDSAILTDTIRLFRDNDGANSGEEAPGRVERVRVYDGPLTPAQVSALANDGDLLLEKDLNTPGDGLLTLDLSTNTEWVDLTQTTNTSVDSINADVGGWVSAGFRVADRTEFNALWHVAGIKAFGVASNDYLGVVQQFIDLFGCNFACSSLSPRSSGLYIRSTPSPGSYVGISEARLDLEASPPTGVSVNCCTVTGDRDEVVWGVYLLRDTQLADSDGDGVNDQLDNCIDRINPAQGDSDGDGYGNQCDADLNNDGVVNFLDIAAWSPFFNSSADGVTDLNEDGQTNFLDYVILTGFYLQAPGPSAYHQ